MKDAARNVLGSLLNGTGEPGAVESRDFPRPEHRLIHSALLELGSGPEPGVLKNHLSELAPDESWSDELETCFGYGAYTDKGFGIYLDALKRERTRSEIMRESMHIVASIESGEETSASRLVELMTPPPSFEPEHISDRFHELFTAGGAPHVPLGLDSLEPLHVTAGDFCVFAARPGAGKTSMLGTLALAAAKGDWRVLFLTLEMPALNIRQRLVSAISGVPLPEVLNPKDSKLAQHESILKDLNLWILDGSTAKLDVEGIVSQVAMFAGPQAVVIVDYLQLVRTRQRIERRHELLGHVCRELKQVALRAKVPIIAAAQLSRAVEQRGANSRPTLSDLRESGEIENTADQVVLMHRLPDKTTLGVAKYRMGPLFVEDVKFIGEQCLFRDFGDWT